MTPAEVLTPTVVHLRMINYCMMAFIFGVFAVSLIVFLRRTDIGHRVLIRLFIAFCLMTVGDSILGLVNLYYPLLLLIGIARLTTSMLGTAMVTYFLVTNRDVMKTLRISEFWTRLKQDEAADSQQSRMNMEYVSQVNRSHAEALVLSRSRL